MSSGLGGREPIGGLPLADARRRQPKTSEVIARQIANHIVDSGMEPGTMLPTEKDMVGAFGVGRTTLREALRLLETRGVLTIKSGPSGGPVVRRPRPSDLGESLTLILQFAGSSLRDVLEARQALEPMMAQLAVQRITPDELDALQRTVDEILENPQDHEGFREANQRFHTLVAEAAGSVVLRVFAETLKTIADGAVTGVRYNPHRRKAIAAAHQRVVDALRAGDGAAAADAMLMHLDEAGRYWARKYGDLVSRPVHWLQ
jgi:GntR family transcriptional regulator, transcriptional repressor for pyruvate dehydrogenase complex